MGQTAFHAYLSDWVRRHGVVRAQLTARPRPDAAGCEWVGPTWVIDLDFVYLFPIELGNRFDRIETYQLGKDAGASSDDSRVADRVRKTNPRVPAVFVVDVRLHLVAQTHHQRECFREFQIVLRKEPDLCLP